MSKLTDAGIEHRISGHDFVRAMMLAGFRFARALDHHVVMVKGSTKLRVPHQPQLDEETILELLQAASVTLPRLATLLHRLGSRDTWPAHEEVAVASASPWRNR
ncbi:MAG TPA: hypothetical protein VHS09_13190 [Polyangiaceae bacterium]|jgi:hypothetical protein|nr:hypothetical protein [Polyangiaceae bacterium]